MVRKSYTPEQIINKLHEAKILLSQRVHHWLNQQEDRSNRANLLPLAERIWWNTSRSGQAPERA